MIASQLVARARADNPHHSNPHSGAGHLAKQTAGSFFGGFRTLARMPAATSRIAGIRNPAQNENSPILGLCQLLPPPPDIGLPMLPPPLPRAVVSRCSKEPGYSITSSARADKPGGTSMPSALAVVRLMTSSNLVGCSTGRSAGFAPFRIFAT